MDISLCSVIAQDVSVGFDGGTFEYLGNLRKMCTFEETILASELLHNQGMPIPLHHFYFLLQKCSRKKDLAAGRRIYYLVVSNGLESTAIMGDCLIRLFDSCGSLQEANLIFCKVSKPTVYTWHAIISAHATHQENVRALELYHYMEQAGVKPNNFIFTCILKVCASAGSIEQGRKIHEKIVQSGLQSDVFIGSTLIDFYCKCGNLEQACKVFDGLWCRNVVSWGAIIVGCTHHEHFHSALELFKKMQREGVKPNEVTFSCILKACGNIGALSQGMLIHEQILKTALESNVFIGNTLVDMYGKCNRLEDARKVFDQLPIQNVVSWNTMIARYADYGHGLPALELFEMMQNQGILPDNKTFSCLLKVCGGIGDIKQGKRIHEQIIRWDLESDVYIGSSLIDMYCKCGTLEDAHIVFDNLSDQNVVSWGAVIAGYAHYGCGISALELFGKMQEQGIKPNEFSFSCALKACGSIGALQEGRIIHNQIRRTGLESCVFVGSSLVDMYAKCGSLDEALEVLNGLPNRNVVSWSAIIIGYAQHGYPLLAVEHFERMQYDGIKPDEVIFSCILEVCSSMGAIEQGKQIHAQIIAEGFGSDVVIGNTLIDMYAKCGNLVDACNVFDGLQDRSVMSWGSMIAAYAQHGNCWLARQCLQNMQQQGLMPDGMMYTNILASCSRAGQVEEGQRYFMSMNEDRGISPTIEHFGCMVDLLGKGGHLNEAEELLEIMPMPPDSTAWMSLLTACQRYSNVELGRQCFEQVVRLDTGVAAGSVIMCNIYADADMCENVYKLEELRRCAGAWKKPGRAWIEVNSKVHEFVAGDKTHPQSDKIYAYLRKLSTVMKEEGYVPQLDLVVEPISDVDKEDALLAHCEKLAIAFGLLTKPEGSSIRVTKNLRVCYDCHNVSKIISRIERRDILINDAYRIHHFSDGVCSCGEP